MEKRWILALADDLTGALEVGAKFAGRGVRALVTTRRMVERPDGEAVLVIDTETRHLPAQEAAAVVGEIARSAQRLGPATLYQKTDSTLRGNIAAEFSAIEEVYAGRPRVFVPAYPALGRTVRQGHLYVDGIPVELTSFARDTLNPVATGDIAKVLGGAHAEIVDGETAADVERAAARIASAPTLPLVAGPAALAEALAARLDLPRGEARPWPRVRSCLLVNGSRHAASAEQVLYALGHGWSAVTPAAALARGGWYVLEAPVEGAGLERARRIGEAVRCLLERAAVEAIAVFGGDTAFGIHAALGHPDFTPYGEVVTGVPFAQAGGLLWLTKAGGFGSAGILCDIQGQLA